MKVLKTANFEKMVTSQNVFTPEMEDEFVDNVVRNQRKVRDLDLNSPSTRRSRNASPVNHVRSKRREMEQVNPNMSNEDWQNFILEVEDAKNKSKQEREQLLRRKLLEMKQFI